jgi:uncharacterized membrane protein HdeD (DUF308 family)
MRKHDALRIWFVVLGTALAGIGAFALVHPEYARGPALVLLGLAVLARGSNGVDRTLRRIDSTLKDEPWRGLPARWARGHARGVANGRHVPRVQCISLPSP